MPSKVMAGRPRWRFFWPLRSLRRWDVLAWWRLSFPVLVTLNRLSMLLLGLIL